MKIFEYIQPFDMHCHVGKWLTPDFCGRQTTLADLIAMYEGLGFTGALVTTTDMADNQALITEINARESSLMLKFAFWVLPDNIDLLKSLSTDVSALKIHPSFLRRPVTDPVFEPFLGLAEQNSWPIVVHCGRWQEIAGYDLALQVANRHPDINFVLSHMGGDSPCLVHETVDKIDALGLKNAFLGTESIRQFDLIQYAVSKLGANRVIFGSDYNLNSPSAFAGVIRDAGLTAAQNERVLSSNALGLLGAFPNNSDRV